MLKRLRASYTVEAALILPISVAVILLLITETLFYRDIVTAERVAMCAAQTGTDYILGSASLGEAGIDYSRFLREGSFTNRSDPQRLKDEEAIAEYAKDLLSGKLWFAYGSGVSAEVKGTDVTVRINLSGPDAVRVLFPHQNGGWFVRKISVTAEGADVATSSRLIAEAWETGNRIEGLSDFFDQIGTLLHKLIG